MPYLNLDLDYFSHPKTIRLVGLLGPGAEVYPLKLWCYCAKFHPETGQLKDYTPEEIEAAAGWSGEKQHLFNLFFKIGFLKKINGCILVNDWRDHAGHLGVFKKRAKTAAKARWKRYATSIATEKSSICLTNAPYLTIPNQALPNKENITSVGANGSKKPNRRTRLPDSEWLKTLESEPAYHGIDVLKELSRCQTFFRERGIVPSRQRFLAWLNRSEQPMAAQAPPVRVTKEQEVIQARVKATLEKFNGGME